MRFKWIGVKCSGVILTYFLNSRNFFFKVIITTNNHSCYTKFRDFIIFISFGSITRLKVRDRENVRLVMEKWRLGTK